MLLPFDTGILRVFVRLVRLPAPVGQLLAIAVTMAFSYLGHKCFTSWSPPSVVEAPAEEEVEAM